MNGFINLYKEKGFTSHDCVAKLRRILSFKKIGHMGTLDPDACGVLPVALGKATRLISLFDEDRKTYRAVMRLGVTTDTLDISGQILSTSPVNVGEDRIRNAVLSFLGEHKQIPPMYSALKKDGKRLYELARQGITVEREPRTVCIHSIEILSVCLPRVEFEVACSRGTYIRSLCDDIGHKLGCGACMEELERTEVGGFHSTDAFTLDAVEEAVQAGKIHNVILPMRSAFPEMADGRTLPEGDTAAHNGNAVPAERLVLPEGLQPDETFWLSDSAEKPVGVFQIKDGRAVPVKMVYED